MIDSLLTFLDSLPAAISLAIGMALLLAGGHALVIGAVHIAQRFGVSTLLIGLTIVAFGTSAPELAFNLVAASSGNGELSFGNVVGSNIANIGLVLGIAALVSPLIVSSRVIKRELPLLIVASLATIGLAFYPEEGFGRTDGLILLAFFLFCMFQWFRMGRADRADPLLREAEAASTDGPMGVFPASLLFLTGLIALLAGGKLAETGAVGIATSLGLSKSLIGLTIVAIATSLPELVTSVLASRKGHTDLAVGNVVGSNLFNLLLVLGATSVFAPQPIPVPNEGVTLGYASGWWDLGVMMLLTLLLVPFAVTNNRRILRREGFVLLLIYAGWLGWGVWRELGG